MSIFWNRLLVFVCFFLFNNLVLSGVTNDFISCYNGAYQVKLPPFNSCSGYRDCEPGYYCLNGVKKPCPAGTFGGSSRLNTTACSGLCPAGFYCPEGIINPISFPCGNSNVYCPVGSASPLAVPIGYYSLDVNNSESAETRSIRSSVVICPIGYYCHNGIKLICPAGRFGNSEGLSNADCSGICPEGYFCPAGTVSPLEFTCGEDPVQYCPEGSGRPNQTSLGYYAVQSEMSKLYGNGYIAQRRCPLGSYCKKGVRSDCPAGRYGLKWQEYNESCTGPCHGGYYCPPGSTSSSQIQCQGTHIYCPAESALPTKVTLGYYTTTYDSGATEAAPFQDFYSTLVQPTSGNLLEGVAYTKQTICEPGYYCLSDGKKSGSCVLFSFFL
jgi:hypothetical protein